MESSKQEVVFELPVRLRVHKDGHSQNPTSLLAYSYLKSQIRTKNLPSLFISAEEPLLKAPEHDVIVLFLLIIQNQANVVADFQLVFLGGSSSGVDIAHNLAMVAGNPEPGLSIGLLRIALAHPYFWGSVPFGSAIYPDDMVLINQGFVQQVWF
ncbi:hypothetical protein NC653_032319 [Populus alba x Populus x berolinensis]|uniref:Alpha/beta hydrolase fold-3 domain-containing protein n=1 Tax=Populus alba x Populus x berolinensis TaxID=444605 RepID=A0AAD6LR22_9ROSI|nr:hypothetical protein NC653_032319 [Populus alba x Populus x berolinensis]